MVSPRLIVLLSISFCSLSAQEVAQKAKLPKVLPLVVLGSGPAGLTAAQYSSRLGIPTTLISGPLRGGLLTQTSSIENYPGVKLLAGAAFMDAMIEQTYEAGVSFIEDMVVSVDLARWPFTLALDNGEQYSALSLVIATGATPKKLGVSGEDEYWGKGVSSCAICDAHFFKGEDVVVVGGGDSAVEEAMQLSPHVNSVTILVRSHRMRAAHSMQQKLHGFSNVKAIEYNKRVTEVIGDDNEVTALEVLDLITNKKSYLPVSGLFLAIGHHPNTDIFEGQLALSDDGHIITQGRGQATSVPGVFAAGDVEDDKYRQAIVSAGRGCAAAIDAVNWLREAGVTGDAIKELSLGAKDTDIERFVQA